MPFFLQLGLNFQWHGVSPFPLNHIDMKHKILGIVLRPFLYARWSFILFLPWFIPSLLNNDSCNSGPIIWGMFIVWVFYICVYQLVMSWGGPFETNPMEKITKWLMRILKVEYKNCRDWHDPMIHSGSVWNRDAIEIKGKKYSFSTPSMGGNSYSYDSSLNRKILFTWLLH